MAHLYLIRHGKSEWNALGLWTGWADPGLAEEGFLEAFRAGEILRGKNISRAYVSGLRRAQQTFFEIKKAMAHDSLEPFIHEALNERHYGIYTGKNKWEVKNAVGEEMFQKMRRGWDVKIPEGETLKDVYMRVTPFFDEHVFPHLLKGNSSLVVAHGNTIRSLMKHIEKLSEDEIADIEVGTGEIYAYEFSDDGGVKRKEIFAANESKGKI